MAKTHLSLSADPSADSAPPADFRIPVRDVRAYTGAGFLGRSAATSADARARQDAAGFDIDIDKDGKIVGIF